MTSPELLLGSAGDSMQFVEPTRLVVHKVVRAPGRGLRQYALGESVSLQGSRRAVAVTLRSRWRWRVSSSREQEALIWRLPDLDRAVAAGRFRPPERGAAVGWVKRGDLAAELGRGRGEAERGEDG